MSLAIALNTSQSDSHEKGGRRAHRTSRSCKLRISDRGGRASTRCKRALSCSVIFISIVSAVPSSTGPRLPKFSIRVLSQTMTSPYCFPGGRLSMMALGGWIGSYSRLRCISSTVGGCRLFRNIRCILPGILQYDLAPT